MTIAQAMKEIARLRKEIELFRERELSCVKIDVREEYVEDFAELDGLIDIKTKQYIDLKQKVMQANIQNNMFTQILLLGELKDEIELWKELFVGSKIKAEHITADAIKTQLTVNDKNRKIETLQEQINDVTDILDDFNSVTQI